MAISNFLNPSDEERDIQDGTPSEDEILQEVIDEHLGLQQTQDDDEEELQERSLHSVKSARQALQVLIEFTEEQEALQSDYLRGLERLEFALEALDQESWVQICLGTAFGDCCSEYGYCGDTSGHCGAGCQSDFGTCDAVTGPPVSTDGTCSSLSTPEGATCAGSAFGDCCSASGYCSHHRCKA
ncbi:hypothetical protein VC83_01438 [Pseudogymnoascus destructans]|uniref:Chitin-binding type-1 domain-containing protein n=1 Tax=Pseudogymnoascus destructans TaxID=655981 RepID=A0A177AJC3_9PEZI|nr:uncharacterized protein VC83_01438 [Pseudogymnoascus destructans]OAF62148.1 hypothetical protein VC83_01438 [Pseudogymnoascus destructans]